MPRKFQVITKQGCSRCEQLKSWLKQQKLPYEEWKLEEEPIKHKLLHDPKFIQSFCNIDGCTVYTPVIRLDDTGEYIFKELFDMSGVRTKYVSNLLKK